MTAKRTTESCNRASVETESNENESHPGMIVDNDHDGVARMTTGQVPDDAAQLSAVQTPPDPALPQGARRLTKNDAWQQTAFAYPTWKKWMVLTIVFVVQVSMNFNASVYANAVPGMMEEFDIGAPRARLGQILFLIAYGFGCELWAPFSEELGRWPVLQGSLAFVNLFQLPCALAPNDYTIYIARLLGGLSSAGGSVTLGIVADMYLPAEQQFAVAFVVLSSVGGSVVGPIAGGFITKYLNWRWVFWIQLIVGFSTQLLHMLCPETDPDALLDRYAKQQRRASAPEQVYGPREKIRDRFAPRKMVTLMLRPYHMLLTEPIVLCLSLLSGFSDALIFSFLESYVVVFKQWNFGPVSIGLSFLPLLVGYLVAYFSYWPFMLRDREIMRKRGYDNVRPERRLFWLLFLAPLECLALFVFGALSVGPSHGIPWIAPLLVSALIGIANYAIYMGTIDYMVAAYGHYSASATGGNGFCRDVLAGIAATYSAPFYHNLSAPFSAEKPSWVLGAMALVITLPLYAFYFKGEWFRQRSGFAKRIAADRKRLERGQFRPDVEKGPGNVARQDSDKTEFVEHAKS